MLLITLLLFWITRVTNMSMINDHIFVVVITTCYFYVLHSFLSSG